MNGTFQHYSKKHLQLYTDDIPRLLELTLMMLNRSVGKFSVLDLGCGDGNLVFALNKKGLLKKAEEVTCADISKDRIERLKKNLPFAKGIVADALSLEQFPDSSFDLVICSQLIEHVKDDLTLASEVRRVLKPNGITYISSVIKKRWGAYIYYREGSFRLDPTHVREYSSAEELTDTVKRAGLELVDIQTRRLQFPILDLITQALMRLGVAKSDYMFHQRRGNINAIRQLQLAVPRYAIVETIFRKTSRH